MDVAVATKVSCTCTSSRLFRDVAQVGKYVSEPGADGSVLVAMWFDQVTPLSLEIFHPYVSLPGPPPPPNGCHGPPCVQIEYSCPMVRPVSSTPFGSVTGIAVIGATV